MCEGVLTLHSSTMTHGAAEVGRLLDERLSRARLLAGDLIEGEEEVVLVCYLGWQLDLHLIIQLWLPARGGGGRDTAHKSTQHILPIKYIQDPC